MKKSACISIAILSLLAPVAAGAGKIPSIPAFTPQDRVLILAPHPDDETLGTGGVIQQALAAGAKVKVVCYTNGDHNEFAFIVYEKRLTFRTGEFLYMGEVRRKETINAMDSLGLTGADLVFLGYPDSGTMAILTQHWQDCRPFRSLLTRISKVEYLEALSPGAPYEGESILQDVKTVLCGFAPTKIFVSHPADTNRDHQSLYLFLQVALWDLEGTIGKPRVYPYIIHVIGWPKPRGHHPDLELYPPPRLLQVSWEQAALTPQEAQTKHDLVSFYKSQIPSNPPYLYTYARKNELFGDFPVIAVKDIQHKEIIWHDVAIAKDDDLQEDESRDYLPKIFSGLAYALKGRDLYIRMELLRKLDTNLGIQIDLLGYSKKAAFAGMPKINIAIGLLGMKVRNKGKAVAPGNIQRITQGKTIILRVPLSVLGEPDYILSRVRSRATRTLLDAYAWRILHIE